MRTTLLKSHMAGKLISDADVLKQMAFVCHLDRPSTVSRLLGYKLPPTPSVTSGRVAADFGLIMGW
jgi:hypothetical protein